MRFDRNFRLSDSCSAGIHCSLNGLLIGGIPLLESRTIGEGRARWRLRPEPEIERDLSTTYGFPIQIAAKRVGLESVANALNAGEVAKAQVAALMLQFPEPPNSARCQGYAETRVSLVKQLLASDLLKGDWDPAKHPRWPADSRNGVGGQFSPRDEGSAVQEPSAVVSPAQVTVPVPLEIPEIVPIPLPSEIAPPLILPDSLPRTLPQNPYPNRPECVREWQEAFAFCWSLKSRGQLGRGNYKRYGSNLAGLHVGSSFRELRRQCGGCLMEYRCGGRNVKQPTTVEEMKILHDMRRTDPQSYLKIVDGWLAEDPNNREAYFDRHFAWMNLGEPLKAMEDMNKVLAFGPEPLAYFSRAEVQKYLGNYEKALEDFGRSEAIIPDEWVDLGFGLLQQADCHARLGDEQSALKCCARLPDDFWTPGMNGAPGGDREAIAEKLRMVAAEARRGRT